MTELVVLFIAVIVITGLLVWFWSEVL